MAGTRVPYWLRTVRPCRLAGLLPCVACLLLGGMLLRPAAGRADEPVVAVRSGNHPGFGRVVFDAPPGAAYRLERDGDRVLVRFAESVTLSGSPPMPNNVLSVRTSGGAAELILAPGASVHDSRLGERVVVDVFDAATNASLPPGAPDSARHSGGPGKSDRRAAPVRAATAPAAAAAPATPVAAAPAAPVAAAVPVNRAAVPPVAPSAVPVNRAAAPPVAPSAVPVNQRPGGGRPAPPGSTPPVAASVSAAPAPKSAAPAPVTAAPAPAAAAGGVATPPAPAAMVPVNPPAIDLARSGSAAPRPDAPSPPSALTLQGDESGDVVGPVALPVQPASLPTGVQGAAFFLPLPAPVGAAVLRRGRDTLVVFDQRRPLDLAPLHNERLWAGARVELLAAGTVIRLALPPGTGIALAVQPQGWTIAALPTPAPPAAIVPLIAVDGIRLPAADPGGVVVVPDQETGGILWVGTQRRTGQAVAVRRRGSQFVLLPTVQGVAVEALSDSVALRVVTDGFTLTAEPVALAISPAGSEAVTDAAVLTRRFEFPDFPRDALIRRLAGQIDTAAVTAPLARGPPRQAAAVTMLALGLNAEAEALLQLAAAEDPRTAAAPETAGLTAIAAMLADRPQEADGIEDPRLTGSDEVALWRSVRTAMNDPGAPQAAAVLASAAPLILTYPAAMRDRLLPLALDTILRSLEVTPQGSSLEVADALLAEAKGLPGLDLARAMLKQARGDSDAALALYDTIAAGHDQSAGVRARVRAVELRLANRRIDPHQAAEALDRLLYAWRGDRSELGLRERVAALRQQAGEWRLGLAMLRETEAVFPDDKADIHPRLEAAFAALLHDDATDKLAPLELVALVDENADLLPATAEGEAMEAKLADRLVALDLPKRAGPLLDKLMQAAPTGTGRAEFGTRLAALRLREGDFAGATAALAASAAPDLPAAQVEQRALLAADAAVRRGDAGAALAALQGISSAAVDEARARLLEQVGDWPAADRALGAFAAKSVPETGELDDTHRRLLLRLATAATRAGDDATLAILHEREDARMGTGPLGDMFRLLTAGPVRSAADLSRAGREVGLARGLPAALKTLQAGAQTQASQTP